MLVLLLHCRRTALCQFRNYDHALRFDAENEHQRQHILQRLRRASEDESMRELRRKKKVWFQQTMVLVCWFLGLKPNQADH
jgi:hypothetical protein